MKSSVSQKLLESNRFPGLYETEYGNVWFFQSPNSRGVLVHSPNLGLGLTTEFSSRFTYLTPGRKVTLENTVE